MDYQQVEEQFKTLKEQFTTGTLDEAAFKAQLNELMVQDGQGRWWMIGYETGQWYVHDGSAWVRADPPGRDPAKPVDLPPEPVKVQAAPEPPVKTTAHTAEPPSDQPEAGTSTAQAVQKPAGFIPNRGREALLVLLGGALSAGMAFFPNSFGAFGYLHNSYAGILFGLAAPLFGILFGPWVGGLAGALGMTISAIFLSNRFMPFVQFIIPIVLGSLSGVIPGLLVKDAKDWKAVAYACVLASALSYLKDFVNLVSENQDFSRWFFSWLVNFLLPGLLLLPLLARWLVNPIQQRGWRWQDGNAGRKAALTNWNAIFISAVIWGFVWFVGWSFVRYSYDFIFGGIGGLLGGAVIGLAEGLILKRFYPVMRWWHVLIIGLGWGIGFFAAYGPLVRMAMIFSFASDTSVYWNYLFSVVFCGLIGGISTGSALKLAGILTQWKQVLILIAVWGVGVIASSFIAKILLPVPLSRPLPLTNDRLLLAGLSAGLVGTWAIFWQINRANLRRANG